MVLLRRLWFTSHCSFGRLCRPILVKRNMSRIRNAARMLLTLYEKDPRRILEGEALLRRMNRYGLLHENQNMLNYVLALTREILLERRLQTLVFMTGMAKSIHHARVLIRQRHISPLSESATSVGAALPASTAKSRHMPFTLAAVFKLAVSSFKVNDWGLLGAAAA